MVDAHGSASALDWIGEKGREYSGIIVGGDLGRSGSEGYASEFLAAALSTCSSVFYIPGNADAPEAEVPKGVTRLHGERATMGGFSVGGLGGSNPTPFRTRFELGDEEARLILSRLGDLDILVSHSPPFDTNCDRAGEKHVGSVPVKEYVVEHGPRLVLCGHAHESKAVDHLGRTVVVNPGPLMQGNFAEVDLGKEIRVELKSGGP